MNIISIRKVLLQSVIIGLLVTTTSTAFAESVTMHIYVKNKSNSTLYVSQATAIDECVTSTGQEKNAIRPVAAENQLEFIFTISTGYCSLKTGIMKINVSSGNDTTGSIGVFRYGFKYGKKNQTTGNVAKLLKLISETINDQNYSYNSKRHSGDAHKMDLFIK